jgi:3-oxoacyl-[acyl-carrier-protein] synthase-1
MDKKIVISGCGIVSSIGNNCNEVLHALQNNRSGIVGLPEWSDYSLKSRVAGTIKMPEIDELRQAIGGKSRFMDLSSIYALCSAIEATNDSKLAPQHLASDRVGCVVGGAFCSMEPLSRAAGIIASNRGKSSPYDVTRSIASSCSANIVNYFGIEGRSYSISSACATSLHNIGHAYELVKNGICDLVLAGGSEEVSPMITCMFNGMRNAISKSYNESPEKASRPYDKHRDGFVISGGSGIAIVEDYEHAQNRGAPIYGEIIGYGASTDGHDIVQPHPEGNGIYRCILEALKMADCSANEIDYINVHATSTPAGDLAEALAIRRAFGEYRVPLSSTKSITGHGIGAAGAQELIYCLLMMRHGFITASVNIEERDEAFEGFNIVTENQAVSLNTILTNSYGFGGTNACLIVRKNGCKTNN